MVCLDGVILVMSGLQTETSCLTAGLHCDAETGGRSLLARSETGHNWLSL